MPKVSVLVPICNVEKFLDKCLSSIINQTLKDIEIICINDGSKDGSLEIIKRYALQDSRIVVINKPNSGYGDSMNQGLGVATGEYIGIVESDDFIEKEMFEELYNLGIQYDADVVKSNFNMYWENPEKYVFLDNLKVTQIAVDTIDNRKSLFWSMPAIWSAIYKRSFVVENNIRFLATPGASYQDTSFKFKTTALAQKIILTPKAYLNYRQDNNNSSVKNASKEKILMLHEEHKEIKLFCSKLLLRNLKKIRCTQMLQGYLWNYSRINKSDKKWYFNYFTSELLEYADDWEVEQKFVDDISEIAYKFLMNKNQIMFDIIMYINKRRKSFVNSYKKRFCCKAL